MPIGSIALTVVGVLIYFGLAQRVLDRMRMTDRAALAFVGAMILGSFVDIRLSRRPDLVLNLGGGLLPVVLAGYLIATAGTAQERSRAVFASLVTASVVYFISKNVPSEPTEMRFLDPLYVFGLVGGLVAYLTGRSRRGAFVAGIMGVFLNDLLDYAALLQRGSQRGRIWIGGAGAFDGIVIAGLVAVLLAEIIGETRELLQGGPEAGEDRPPDLMMKSVSPEERPSATEPPAAPRKGPQAALDQSTPDRPSSDRSGERRDLP